MTVVLAYHRIAELESDPQSLAVSQRHFAEQLEALRAVADVVPLRNVLDGSAAVKRVAITFDDGYGDNADAALPILEAASAHATMFVTEGMIGQCKEFWWDELDALLMAGDVEADHVDMAFGADRIWADVRDSAGRLRLYHALQPRLRRLPSERIDQSLELLSTQLGVPRSARRTHLPLDEAQLRQLADSDYTEVGAHSVSHSLLRPLSTARQEKEVRDSKMRLQDRLECSVDLFAYPFGGPDSFSRTTKNAVRRAGYLLACANVPGRIGRRSPRFALPRHLVRDWDGDVFAARLHAWLED